MTPDSSSHLPIKLPRPPPPMSTPDSDGDSGLPVKQRQRRRHSIGTRRADSTSPRPSSPRNPPAAVVAGPTFLLANSERHSALGRGRRRPFLGSPRPEAAPSSFVAGPAQIDFHCRFPGPFSWTFTGSRTAASVDRMFRASQTESNLNPSS